MRADEEAAVSAEAAPGRGLIRRGLGLAGRHPLITGSVLAIGLGLFVFVLVYFQPQKLFIDDRVNEAMPGALSGATELATGEFRPLAHGASGEAHILQAADGSRTLRLEDLNVENGPDLFVYLSTTPGTAEEGAFPGRFVNLGRLKGNIGSQNYALDANIDVTQYRSVVIYCKRFSTAFAAAPLG